MSKLLRKGKGSKVDDNGDSIDEEGEIPNGLDGRETVPKNVYREEESPSGRETVQNRIHREEESPAIQSRCHHQVAR